MRALELRCALAGATEDNLLAELITHKVEFGEFISIYVTDEGVSKSHYLTRETAGQLFAWLGEALHTIT